jgi:hypothetical protein
VLALLGEPLMSNGWLCRNFRQFAQALGRFTEESSVESAIYDAIQGGPIVAVRDQLKCFGQ